MAAVARVVMAVVRADTATLVAASTVVARVAPRVARAEAAEET